MWVMADSPRHGLFPHTFLLPSSMICSLSTTLITQDRYTGALTVNHIVF